jgi:hypothetical protein
MWNEGHTGESRMINAHKEALLVVASIFLEGSLVVRIEG